MNAFDQGRIVEAKGMLVLAPFLEERADGKIVFLTKGPLARALQERMGDAIFTAKDGSARAVEIKIEQRHTGNLFLETWSNRNLEDRDRHTAVGSNVGWMFKCTADWLLYYFINTDALYVFNLLALQRWAFCHENKFGTCGRIWEFSERVQQKLNQLNDTRGRIVRLDVLSKEVGYQLIYLKQLEMFPEDGTI